MNIDLDINAARLAHVGWEFEVERVISGKQASQALLIHKECALGRWVTERGLTKYEMYEEIFALNNEHKRFHAVADKIIGLN